MKLPPELAGFRQSGAMLFKACDGTLICRKWAGLRGLKSASHKHSYYAGNGYDSAIVLGETALFALSVADLAGPVARLEYKRRSAYLEVLRLRGELDAIQRLLRSVPDLQLQLRRAEADLAALGGPP